MSAEQLPSYKAKVRVRKMQDVPRTGTKGSPGGKLHRGSVSSKLLLTKRALPKIIGKKIARSKNPAKVQKNTQTSATARQHEQNQRCGTS